MPLRESVTAFAAFYKRLGFNAIHLEPSPLSQEMGRLGLERYTQLRFERDLMVHSGEVLSRGEIMEHVWDMNTDIFSNTIESHIRNIRKKLGPVGKKIIHNIPGRGYKVEFEK